MLLGGGVYLVPVFAESGTSIFSGIVNTVHKQKLKLQLYFSIQSGENLPWGHDCKLLDLGMMYLGGKFREIIFLNSSRSQRYIGASLL